MFNFTAIFMPCWSFFALLLNTALLFYLPYTFFFFQSLPPVQLPQILSSSLLILFQIIQILIKLQTQSSSPQSQPSVFSIRFNNQKDNHSKIFHHKTLILDILGIVSLISTFIDTETATPFRLLIYCKIPSIVVYDKYLSTIIKSWIIDLLYTLLKIMLIYLVFCNLTAGAFFKLDYYIFSLEGFYFENGMVWLVSASSMANIIDWDYTIHYLYSIYWSIITACTIGYGDITPLNPYEVILVCIIFVPNILFYGYLIDNINLNFTKLNEIDEMIEYNEVSILKILQEKRVENKVIRFFKYHIKKVYENNVDEKNVVYNPLSKILKINLNQQIYELTLNKLGKLQKETLEMLCDSIEECNYESKETIEAGKKYLYVIEGSGNIWLKKLDVCSYKKSRSIVQRYKEKQTLNIYNYLTERENRFVEYEAGRLTRVYEIKEWVDTEEMRERKKEVLIDRRYGEYGIECVICNSTEHPTEECFYLVYNRRFEEKRREQEGESKENNQGEVDRNEDERTETIFNTVRYRSRSAYPSKNDDGKDKNQWHGRDKFKRHDRQNETVKKGWGEIVRFEECFVKEKNLNLDIKNQRRYRQNAK